MHYCTGKVWRVLLVAGALLLLLLGLVCVRGGEDISVGAAEPTVTIQADESVPLYSWMPAGPALIGSHVTGTVNKGEDGSDAPLAGYNDATVFNVYKMTSDGEFVQVTDFRPDEGFAVGDGTKTYERWIEAVVRFEDGQTATSNRVRVTVTADMLLEIVAEPREMNKTFYALETVTSERLYVVAIYAHSSRLGVEIGEAAGGRSGWRIVYENDAEDEDDTTEYLEYGDTCFTVYYREGDVEVSCPVTGINVIEAYIDAPVPAGNVEDFTYNGKMQHNAFTKFERERISDEYDGSLLTRGETDGHYTYAAAEAGRYSVTFRVLEGYQFLDIPRDAVGIYDEEDAEKLVAVTYTWEIGRAVITDVLAVFPTSWVYGTAVSLPAVADIGLKTEPGMEGLTAAGEEVSAKARFLYAGTSNGGAEFTDAETLPREAGAYAWRLELSGMRNFEDFFGTAENGGAGRFTIERRILTVPALQESRLLYTGGQRTAEAVFDGELMAFNGGVEETRINVGTYHATFTLKDFNNYAWPSESNVSGDHSEIVTVEWEIVQAENSITSFSAEGWTFGETEKTHSATATFGIPVITYSGTANDGTSCSDGKLPRDESDRVLAGTYTATATVEGTANYKSASQEIEVTVERKEVAQPTLSGGPFTYDGTEQAPTVAESEFYTATITGQINAGENYAVEIDLNDSNNYKWAAGAGTVSEDGKTITLTWSIAKAAFGVESVTIENWTYGESPKEPEVTFDEHTESITGGVTIEKTYTWYAQGSDKPLDEVPTETGNYSVVVMLTGKNFNDYKHAAVPFTIAPDTPEFSDPTENLDWTWGKISDFAIAIFIPTVTYGQDEEVASDNIIIEYYKYDNQTRGDKITITEEFGFEDLDAGSYVMVVSVTEGDNYTAGEKEYPFEVTQGEVSAVTIDIENEETWYYLDGESHAITISFTVGEKTLSSGFTVTYVTRGWDTSAAWGAGTPLTGTPYTIPADAKAGEYRIVVTVDGNNNYTGGEAEKQFTIARKELSVSDDNRQLEYQGNTPQAPADIINVADSALVPEEWKDLVGFDGYYSVDEEGTTTQLETAPSDYGSYYVRLELLDTNNYAWKKPSDTQLGPADKIDGAFYDAGYQITGVQYEIVVSAGDLEIGKNTFSMPSFKAATGFEEALAAVLETEGTTVTFTFYRVNASGDYEAVGEPVSLDGIELTGGSYTLGRTQLPAEVAENAGNYLVVVIVNSTTNNYADARSEANFTISPYTLTEDDITWSSDGKTFIYNGEEVPFSGEDSDITANYKYWKYNTATGAYEKTGTGYLDLSLENADEIRNAGDYTLIASAPNGNVTLPEEYAEKLIIVDRASFIVEVSIGDITYGDPVPEKTAYSVSFSEAYAGDVDDLKDLLNFAHDYEQGGNVKDYTVSVSFSEGEVLKNYDVTIGAEVTTATLKVNPRKITVTLKDQSGYYGEQHVLTVTESDANDSELYEITSGELYGDDTPDKVFRLNTDAEKGSSVGQYNISIDVLSTNYTVTPVNTEKSYEVKPRPVQIGFTGEISAVYGTQMTHETLETYVAFKHDGSDADVFVGEGHKGLALGAMAFDLGDYSATSDAGTTWTVTASLDTTAEGIAELLQNYTFTAAEGTMTVGHRPVTVVINDVTGLEYGDEEAVLTVSSVEYNGEGEHEAIIERDLAGGDTLTEQCANVFTLALYYKNGAELGDKITTDYSTLDAGEYYISLETEDDNYEFTFDYAEYKIAQKSVSVSLAVVAHNGVDSPVYDGLPWEYSATGENVKFTVVYYLQDENGKLTGDPLSNAPTDEGKYVAVVPKDTSGLDDNYVANQEVSYTFTIAKRGVELKWTADNFTYSGVDRSKEILASFRLWENGSEGTTVVGLDMIVKPEFKDVNTGGYTFTAELPAEYQKNYKIIGSTSAEQTYDVLNDSSAQKTYHMAPASITVDVSDAWSYYGDPLAEVVPELKEGNAFGKDLGKIVTLTVMKDADTELNKGDDAGTSYYIKGVAVDGNFSVTWISRNTETGEVAKYTIKPRPVKIVITNFQTIYGTDISQNPDLLKALFEFGKGDGVETGDIFIETDAAEEAKGYIEFTFAPTGDTTESYSVKSAAGSSYTVTLHMSEEGKDAFSNYAFEEVSVPMEVIPRPVQLTLQTISTNYTYGTEALQGALAGWKTFVASSETLIDWAGYGDAVVNGDVAYELVVSGKSGEAVTDFGADTDVGTYTLTIGNVSPNYKITFAEEVDEVEFEIAAAEFKVVEPDELVDQYTYTGNPYYFRGTDPSGNYLFNHGLEVTTAGFIKSCFPADEDITWTFTVDDKEVTYLTMGGAYEVTYSVSADNFKKLENQTFTVVIGAAENVWTDGETTENGGAFTLAGWTYGDNISYTAEGFTETFLTFTAKFGTAVVEYYSARGGDSADSYTYDPANKAESFSSVTPAGTYYVKVYVSGIEGSYNGLTAHGTFEVQKRSVDIDWVKSNLTEQTDGKWQNTTMGYDGALMRLAEERLPADGLTIELRPDDEDADGEYTVSVDPSVLDQYYLVFELINPANYCWEESPTVSGENGEYLQIFFTINAIENTIEFYGANGQIITEITVEYGSEPVNKFAENESDVLEEGQDILIKVASVMRGEDYLPNVAFAVMEDGAQGAANAYNLASLAGNDVGTYWMRVIVSPQTSSDYGYAVGYLKVIVTPKTVTAADLAGVLFEKGVVDVNGNLTVTYEYDGEAHLPVVVGGTLPNYLTVSFDKEGQTDAGDYALTATFTLRGNATNYQIKDGVSLTKALTLIIEPKKIGNIVWSDRTYTYNGTDQSGAVYAFFTDIYGREHRLQVTASGSFTNVGDVPIFTAQFALYTEDESFKLSNYKFADGIKLTYSGYTMQPYKVNVSAQEQSFTYSGGEVLFDKTAFLIDGLSPDEAKKNVLYQGLLDVLSLTLSDSAVNVGEYPISYTDGGNAKNYDIHFTAANVVITPAPLTLDRDSLEEVLTDVFGAIDGVDASKMNFLGFFMDDGYADIEDFLTVTYNGEDYEDWAESLPAHAGKYEVRISLAAEKDGKLCNYSLEEGPFDYVIEKQPIEPPVIEEQFLKQTYTGETLTSGLAPTALYSVEDEGGVNVGTYTAVVTLTEPRDYRWTTTDEASVTLAYEIVAARYEFEVTLGEGWTYGEDAKKPELSGDFPEGGVPSYRFTGRANDGTEWDSDEAPQKAGSYTLTATFSGIPNYQESSAECAFTIARAAMVIDVSGLKDLPYTGKPQYITGITLSVGDGVLTYSKNGFTDVGDYEVTIYVAQTDNYLEASKTVTVSIVRAAYPFTVTIEGWTYGEYNAEKNAPVIEYQTTDEKPADAVQTITYAPVDAEGNPTGDFTANVPENAGRYVVKVELTGMNNYNDAEARSDPFTISKAATVIDTSGVRTDFTYDGEEHSVTGGAVLNHNETTLVYSSNTFTDAGEYDVTISAEQTDNYEAAEVTVTVVVHKAELGLNVAIDGWTYGEEPNAPSVTGNAGGGEVIYRYTGTTNAGAAYESELAPTEAGEYTVTATAAETDNYQVGTASADFTVGRAAAETQLTLEDWYFGDEPNAYVLTPDFLMDEVIRVLYADEDGSFSEKPPVYAGEYTITVYYGETANYTAGEATASFTVIERPLQMSVTLEDWTYGDEPNEPVVTGAYGIALTYRYTGTANDGTSWNSDTAPVKAGEYTLTVTTADLENYDNATCSTDFTIMRRLISAPAWDEEGLREFTEEHNGKTNTIIVVGYDGSLMTAEADGVRFELTTGGGAAVAADIHGVYTIIFTLKDAANYGWTDLNEGEGLTDPVTLTWTLTEHVISILWLIILLAVLILIALIILIVLLKKNKKYGKGNTPDGGAAGTQGASPDGNTAEGEAVQAAGESGAADQGTDGSQGGSGETRLSSFAPIGLLLVIVPLGEVIAAIVLGVVLVGLIIADIAVGVRVHKLAKAAEAASDPGTLSEEIASAEEAMASEDVPDESAEEVADVQPEEGLETAAADDAASGEGEYPDAAYGEGEPADGFGTQGEDAGTNPDGAGRPEDMGGMPE